MSDAEIFAWVDSLAPTQQRRLNLINGLLMFARQDGMTSEDVHICRVAKRYLEESIVLEEMARVAASA